VYASNASNIGTYSSQSSTGKLGAKEDSCQLLRTGVAVEKLPPEKFAEKDSRQDAV